MKNFQVKHGQCDSIIFLKTFSLESSKQVVESIHKFIIELHVLQCLFVRGPDKKNKGGVGLFQISQKERLFHLS